MHWWFWKPYIFGTLPLQQLNKIDILNCGVHWLTNKNHKKFDRDIRKSQNDNGYLELSYIWIVLNDNGHLACETDCYSNTGMTRPDVTKKHFDGSYRIRFPKEIDICGFTRPNYIWWLLWRLKSRFIYFFNLEVCRFSVSFKQIHFK